MGNAKDADGKVYDLSMEEELLWDKSKPSAGQWDMCRHINIANGTKNTGTGRAITIFFGVSTGILKKYGSIS